MTLAVLFACSTALAGEMGDNRVRSQDWSSLPQTAEYAATEWLAGDGEAYTLWSGSLDGAKYAAEWNPATLEITVLRDGIALDDVYTELGEYDRVSFAGAWSDGQPTLTGMVYVHEDARNVVVQIQTGLNAAPVRIMAGTIADEGDFIAMAMAATRTCLCFGIGTPTGTCSDTNCDQGDSCGTGSKACRWKSGSAVAAMAEGSALQIDP